MRVFDFVGDADEKNKRTDIDYTFVLNKFKVLKCWDTGLYDLLRHGHYKSMGFCYDFRGDLKHYVVKQYGEWCEYYAPNKTLLRKVLCGKVQKILDYK